ncbi:restriction endonuclease subunit S, partial [Catenibacterium sp.]|uniref:restriction endonuclease subunit S n=1 Tax=Catenibacterium sp. TaxID=2049022 RepID=UPI004029E2D4
DFEIKEVFGICSLNLIPLIFLQGLLVNENYQGKLLQIAKSGATREAINKQQLESLEIMIPPLELQNQFASFVKEIDKSRLLSNHSLFLIKSIIF